ncbi:hypothetical protein DCD75_18445, partial [Acinetobacter baumannii]
GQQTGDAARLRHGGDAAGPSLTATTQKSDDDAKADVTCEVSRAMPPAAINTHPARQKRKRPNPLRPFFFVWRLTN